MGPRAAARRILNTVLPPTCAGCGAVILEADTLCAPCWNALTFLAQPCCDACGHPFEYVVAQRTLCAVCMAAAPPFAHARAALRYDEASKALILGFKHADHTEYCDVMAKWMAVAGDSLLRQADVIVPVPLHWTRLFARRYNQAALLALALGRISHTAVAVDALVRRRKTPSQGHLGAEARARSVQGAFRPAKRGVALIRARNVLLVDDVYTTGATARAVVRVLLRAGAERVNVLSLARVVRPSVPRKGF